MKRILNLLLAGLTAVTLSFGAIGTAEAGRGTGAAVAGGIIGGLALGAILGGPRATYVESCYEGPPRCRTVRDCFENRWGDEICERREQCYRERVCD